MKKNIIGFTVLIFFLSNGCAFAQKEPAEASQTGYQKIIILDKGVRRVMMIQTEGPAKKNTYSAENLRAKSGILVSFNNVSDVSIGDFEKKYGLKLKEKMIIGYYIFDNVSKYSDVEILERIINDETNIKSVKPNWKKLNTVR